jgi:predicted 3-demethylubiquinone-9 3-methyltransferase (glyoxalase superfamily)
MPTHKITPCLWFDTQAEDAARFYTSVFPNSRITSIARYGEAGREFHRREPGSVLIVGFELDGQPFTALNGGPQFTFSEAVSFQVPCDTQEEIDFYWDALVQGGGEHSQCGWLKDKFGLSWQIFPEVIDHLFRDHTSPACQRAFAAMMQMTKLDIAALQRAYNGG